MDKTRVKELRDIRFAKSKDRFGNVVLLHRKGDYCEAVNSSRTAIERLFNTYIMDDPDPELNEMDYIPYNDINMYIRKLALEGYQIVIVDERENVNTAKEPKIEQMFIYLPTEDEYKALRSIIEGYAILGKIAYEDRGYDSENDVYVLSTYAERETHIAIWYNQHNIINLQHDFTQLWK